MYFVDDVWCFASLSKAYGDDQGLSSLFASRTCPELVIPNTSFIKRQELVPSNDE